MSLEFLEEDGICNDILSRKLLLLRHLEILKDGDTFPSIGMRLEDTIPVLNGELA